jgi:3-oxoadipate enol-lactonase
MSDQAADCRALLQFLGVDRAGIVGHSFGACVAMQMAIDSPSVVQSLALLEPGVMIGTAVDGYREALAAGIARFREGEVETLVDSFLRARWPDYTEALEGAVPGAFGRAVADAATTFEVELPSQLEWRFGEDEVRRIAQPALSVLGGDSESLWDRFGDVHRRLLEILPRAEGFVLPGTTHMMILQKPGELADALASFFARA